MTTPQIDPRHRPLRGIGPIADYIGLPYQITLRAIHRGLIDADKDGKIHTSTPARIDASPLIVGRSPATAA